MGAAVTGGPAMTPENIQLAHRALRRLAQARRRQADITCIHVLALEAIGASSAEDLEVVVGDGEIILRLSD